MSWKEPKVEPSPGSFPSLSEAEIKRKPDLKDLYLAVSSLASHSNLHDVTSSPISAILGKVSKTTLEIYRKFNEDAAVNMYDKQCFPMCF